MLNRRWLDKELTVFLSFWLLGILAPTCSEEVLTNHWYVELHEGGEGNAIKVAKRTGFSYVSPVSMFLNYIVRHYQYSVSYNIIN